MGHGRSGALSHADSELLSRRQRPKTPKPHFNEFDFIKFKNGLHSRQPVSSHPIGPPKADVKALYCDVCLAFVIEHLAQSITDLLTILFTNYRDYLFKMLLIGNSGVGKSCLLVRYAVSASLKMAEKVLDKMYFCARPVLMNNLMLMIRFYSSL